MLQMIKCWMLLVVFETFILMMRSCIIHTPPGWICLHAVLFVAALWCYKRWTFYMHCQRVLVYKLVIINKLTGKKQYAMEPEDCSVQLFFSVEDAEFRKWAMLLNREFAQKYDIEVKESQWCV